MGADDRAADALANPILNRPYDVPTRYFELGPHGPTGVTKEGRRPSESLVPIAASRKGTRQADGSVQATLESSDAERRERNELINDLRREIERWRHRDYERVTPTSRKLLQHWADPARENRVLFCQREAAETRSSSPRSPGGTATPTGGAGWTRANADHNAGLPRVALKMATGAGKTVVMAMLIAWQTANKVASPRDARFTKRFLVVTPGITIRDRLRVLHAPTTRATTTTNASWSRPTCRGPASGADRHHQLPRVLPKDAKEITGVSAATRKLLLGGDRADDPFRETPEAMVARVLRDIGGGHEPSRRLQRRGAPLLPGQAAATAVERRSSSRGPAGGERRGAGVVPRLAGRGPARPVSRAIYDLSATPVLPRVAPATTRATSSRGRSATSR